MQRRTKSQSGPVYRIKQPWGRFGSRICTDIADYEVGTSIDHDAGAKMAYHRANGWITRVIGLGMGLMFLSGCGSIMRGLGSIDDNHLLHSTREITQKHPVPLPRELAKQTLGRYIVEPGDVLLVQPADFQSPVRLPGDQPVLPDGTIDLGKYGRLVVAGKSIDEIQAMVQASVAAQVKAPGYVQVRIVNRISKVFYVLGEVNAPGAYPYLGRETILDGILAAGGLTESSARNQIILARPTPPDSCRVVLPVCYNRIVQHGDTTTNYQLLPGDRIFVPKSCGCGDWLGWGKKKDPCGCFPPIPCDFDGP